MSKRLLRDSRLLAHFTEDSLAFYAVQKLGDTSHSVIVITIVKDVYCLGADRKFSKCNAAKQNEAELS